MIAPLWALGELPWWHVAGWTMLHFLWLGSLVTLAALAGRLLLRRASPEVRYGAALVSLALLAALPAAIAVWVAAGVQAEPRLASAERDRAAPIAAVGELDTTNPPAAEPPLGEEIIELKGWSVASDATIGGEILFDDGTIDAQPTAGPAADLEVSELEGRSVGPGDATIRGEAIFDGAAIDPSHGEESESPWRAAVVPLVAWLPWLWIVGTPLTFALLVTGVVGAERLRRRSRAIDSGPIAEACRRLVESLGVTRRVTVAVCERLAAPVLVGIVRPMILLPPAALTGWSPDEIEMVLLHELAHVRRWDNLVNLGQRLIESLLFFHPGVWLVSGWIRREREACCDAVVVGATERPQAYAELLVALAAQMPRSVLFHPAATSAMSAGPLRGRIRRILQVEEDPMLVSGKSMVLVAAAVLAAATAAVIYLPTVGQAEQAAAENVEIAESGESAENSATEARESLVPVEANEAVVATVENELIELNDDAPADTIQAVDAVDNDEVIVLTTERLELDAAGGAMTIDAEGGRVRITATARDGDSPAELPQSPDERVVEVYDVPDALKESVRGWQPRDAEMRGVWDERGRFVVQATRAAHDQLKSLIESTPTWRRVMADKIARNRQRPDFTLQQRPEGPRLEWHAAGLTFGEGPAGQASDVAAVGPIRGRRTGGVLVVDVAPGSPAAWADIQPGDILTSLEGFQTWTLPELASVLNTLLEGFSSKKEVNLRIEPLGGRRTNQKSLPLRLERREATTETTSRPSARQQRAENLAPPERDAAEEMAASRPPNAAQVATVERTEAAVGGRAPADDERAAHEGSAESSPAERSVYTDLRLIRPLPADAQASDMSRGMVEAIERAVKAEQPVRIELRLVGGKMTIVVAGSRESATAVNRGRPEYRDDVTIELPANVPMSVGNSCAEALRQQGFEVLIRRSEDHVQITGRRRVPPRPVPEGEPAEQPRTLFPSLEEQKLIDFVLKHTGMETEPIRDEDLAHVKGLGFEGGVKVVRFGSIVAGAGPSLQRGDLLVGLGVWPTKSLEDVAEVLRRDDLTELNPLKYYVVKEVAIHSPAGPPQTDYSLFSGRIQVKRPERVTPRDDASRRPTVLPAGERPPAARQPTGAGVSSVAAPAGALAVLREHVEELTKQFERVDALYQQGSVGAQSDDRKQAAYELALARGELALAEGKPEEAALLLEEAVAHAAAALKAVTKQYGSGNVTHDRLLQAMRDLTEIKLKLTRLTSGDAEGNGEAGPPTELGAHRREAGAPTFDAPPLLADNDSPPKSAVNSLRSSRANLRYDGKSFDEWVQLWRNELSTERRIEAIQALAAFGASGYGQEAAAAILDVAGEYEFASIDGTAEGRLIQAALDALVPPVRRHSMAEYWLPDLARRLEEKPAEWLELARWLLPRVRTDNPQTIAILKSLMHSGPPEIRATAFGAYLRNRSSDSESPLGDGDNQTLVIDALRGDDQEMIVAALQFLSQRGEGSPAFEILRPELMRLLFHKVEAVRKNARSVLRQIPEEDAPAVVQELTAVLQDGSRRRDERVEAIRSLAVLRHRAEPAVDVLEEIVAKDTDSLRIPAAAALRAILSEFYYTTLLGRAVGEEFKIQVSSSGIITLPGAPYSQVFQEFEDAVNAELKTNMNARMR